MVRWNGEAILKKAMPQQAGMSTHRDAVGNLSCPYQANVMKMLETQSSKTGVTNVQVM